jgi:hypothetical protein
MAKTATRKSPARKAAPSRPVPPPGAGAGGPVQIDATGSLDEEREVLFVITRASSDAESGEEVLVNDEYTMPKKVRPAFAIKYLNDLRKHGDAVAVAEAMAILLGEEAMDAMSECEHITDDHMEQIMKIIEQKMAAASGKILGNG